MFDALNLTLYVHYPISDVFYYLVEPIIIN